VNITNLVPVSSLVHRYGVKAVLYSGPGMGKTPLLTTAPAPVICFTEPGFLSVRKYQGPAYPAFTYREIKEFWMWAIQSREAQQFQTKCCDSISQMAEIILAEELPRHKDPRKAYGELSLKMMEIMNWIYFAPNLHALLIAKEGSVDFEGTTKQRPYFPGQDLNIKIPHLFDSVWRIENVQTAQGLQRVIRTRESITAFARDRSGNLADLETPDINYLFQKAMQ
jgi:hypothetical protein